MRPHTKFRANRSIFREVMTFRIFSRWLPSAILNFEKFKFWIHFRGRSQNLRLHTKFGQNRLIGVRDIAIKPKSKMAAAAMLNLLPVYFLTHFEDCGSKICLHTKFYANRTIFGEVITFHKFSRWLPPRSRDITICNSGPHTKSSRCSELAVQIFLVFCHFACKMPNHGEFWGSYPQNLTLIILTPKSHILG